MSQTGKVDQQDLIKVAKGAGLAAAGAGMTYVTAWITSTEFGDWTPVVVAVWAIVVNAARKWIQGP